MSNSFYEESENDEVFSIFPSDNSLPYTNYELKVDYDISLCPSLDDFCNKSTSVSKSATKTKQDEPKKAQIFANKKIFNVIYPDINENNLEKRSESDESLSEKEDYSEYLKKKRSKNKQNRYTNKHEILKNISRNFFNTYLINFLNKTLKGKGNFPLIKKFPSCLVSNVTEKFMCETLNMTLGQILSKIGITYTDIEESEINKILNTKKISELYEDYLNSNEYRNKIKKLKEKHKSQNDYIKKYIAFSKHFLEQFLIIDL